MRRCVGLGQRGRTVLVWWRRRYRGYGTMARTEASVGRSCSGESGRRDSAARDDEGVAAMSAHRLGQNTSALIK